MLWPVGRNEALALPVLDVTRQFDFVRTNLEYVQRRDWSEFIARQYTAVAEDGGLIVCHYRRQEDERVDVHALLIRLGYAVVGQAEAPGG